TWQFSSEPRGTPSMQISSVGTNEICWSAPPGTLIGQGWEQFGSNHDHSHLAGLSSKPSCGLSSTLEFRTAEWNRNVWFGAWWRWQTISYGRLTPNDFGCSSSASTTQQSQRGSLDTTSTSE